MTASAWQPFSGDDWMKIADAVGVTATSGAHDQLPDYRPHPAHRDELGDAGLAHVLSNWSRAAAGIEVDETLLDAPVSYWPVECEACGDTGMVDVVRHGVTWSVTCYRCGGQ